MRSIRKIGKWIVSVFFNLLALLVDTDGEVEDDQDS